MQDIDIYDLKNIRLEKQPRPDQITLNDFTKTSILNNMKYILIDAPVGIGKSVYAVMFMDWFKKHYDISAQFDLLTNSKILQEQYTNEFDFMNSLWGKGSYECEKYKTDCGTGSEFARIQKSKCDMCPYAIAKFRFEKGDVALTNFHLFLTYMCYMPMAWKRSSRVLIIDEAHDFESVFCDFITTKVSKNLLKRNGLNDTEIIDAMNCFGYELENLTIHQFVEIIQGPFLDIIKSVISRLNREAEDGSLESLKSLQSLSNHFLKWQMLSEEYDKHPKNWILEAELVKRYGKDKKLTDQYWELTAQPVWAHPYLFEKVWSKYDYVIFMSGTILDKKLFCDMNALEPNDTAYISLDSPFPVENRPIYFFHKTGKQTYKTKEITWGAQLPVLKKILKKHKNEKGIIHTANYEIQSWVTRDINENRILSHDSTNRSEFLQQHYNSKEPTVLCSPSMHVGVDLKDDYSRHQTILKVPYPNLGSKKIKQRMETMKEYYPLTTVRDLVQSYGRSVRSMDDRANTYILDSCFTDVLKWSGKYIPQWVKAAIQYVE